MRAIVDHDQFVDQRRLLDQLGANDAHHPADRFRLITSRQTNSDTAAPFGVEKALSRKLLMVE